LHLTKERSVNMLKTLIHSTCARAAISFIGPARADDYALDPTHSGFTFKIRHRGVSWTYSRFNAGEGTMRSDPDPAKTSFTLPLKTDSIDMGDRRAGREADWWGAWNRSVTPSSR
jgi:polyisoprenoid-binding protein YceI